MADIGDSAAGGDREGRRDAIILVPGLGVAPHMTSGHVADVLAHELDRAATTASARFVIRPGPEPSAAEADAGTGGPVDVGPVDVVRTVLRVDDGVAVPVADVYTVDHTAPFRDEQVPVRPVGRVLCWA